MTIREQVFILLACVMTSLSFVFPASADELACSDLHGGYKCRIQKNAPADDKPQENLPGLPQCKTNDDCVVTSSGGCAIKGIVPGTPNRDGKCVCATGPTVFGCLSESYRSLNQ